MTTASFRAPIITGAVLAFALLTAVGVAEREQLAQLIDGQRLGAALLVAVGFVLGLASIAVDRAAERHRWNGGSCRDCGNEFVAKGGDSDFYTCCCVGRATLFSYRFGR